MNTYPVAEAAHIALEATTLTNGYARWKSDGYPRSYREADFHPFQGFVEVYMNRKGQICLDVKVWRIFRMSVQGANCSSYQIESLGYAHVLKRGNLGTFKASSESAYNLYITTLHNAYHAWMQAGKPTDFIYIF